MFVPHAYAKLRICGGRVRQEWVISWGLNDDQWAHHLPFASRVCFDWSEKNRCQARSPSPASKNTPPPWRQFPPPQIYTPPRPSPLPRWRNIKASPFSSPANNSSRSGYSTGCLTVWLTAILCCHLGFSTSNWYRLIIFKHMQEQVTPYALDLSGVCARWSLHWRVALFSCECEWFHDMSRSDSSSIIIMSDLFHVVASGPVKAGFKFPLLPSSTHLDWSCEIWTLSSSSYEIDGR